MIDITRNKDLFAREIRRQTEQLEARLFREVRAILNKTFVDTANMIKHGDPLNIVPVVVNKYSEKIKNTIKTNYTRIGSHNFDAVAERLQEIKPKGINDYYKKDSNYNFWYYFNVWSSQQALSKSTIINKTTKNVLRAIIDKGIRGGKSYLEISKDLRKIGGISNKNRASMIAITETHTAFNKSTFDSIESNNVKMETKEWLNAGDERVRSEPFNHWEANGEQVPMHEKFVKTGEPLMYPGDITGSAANIIRCRCVQLFYTAVTVIKRIWNMQGVKYGT